MKPLWISHRGYKADAAENTAAAFRAAVTLGFRVLETDLRLTRDGAIVLHHDPLLGSAAGRYAGTAVAGRTRRELTAIEPQLYYLDEFIAEFLDYAWILDIKPETGDGVCRALLNLVRQGGVGAAAIAHARYVTWNSEHERRLKRWFPAAQLYAPERACWRAGLAALSGAAIFGGIERGQVYALPPRLGKLSLYRPHIVGTYHARGARVLAFLPETDEDTRAAIAAGCDEILTNGRLF